jgi:phage terminase small subunit
MLNALKLQPKPSMKRYLTERERERERERIPHVTVVKKKNHEKFTYQILTEKMHIPNVFRAKVTS